MTLIADIQTATRSVVTAIGATWQYRKRTNSPATQVGTFGSYVNVTAFATAGTFDEQWDEEHRTWRKREVVQVRVSDATADITVGDQLKSPEGVVYAVEARQTTGVGTVRYRAGRDLGVLQQANSRNGGV